MHGSYEIPYEFVDGIAYAILPNENGNSELSFMPGGGYGPIRNQSGQWVNRFPASTAGQQERWASTMFASLLISMLYTCYIRRNVDSVVTIKVIASIGWTMKARTS